MSDALPSNAGDRYHFAYVARRMIDMLHPRSRLSLIEMENVALQDRVDLQDPEPLLGVDVTEYFGATNMVDADEVAIVQVKYSPLHPDKDWTVSRLVANKTRAGTSVIKKLANAFDFAYQKRLNSEARGLRISLYSNQRLDAELRDKLAALKSLIAGMPEKVAGAALKRAMGSELVPLQETTKLSWTKFAAFLNAWQIETFDQEPLSGAEAALFKAVEHLTSSGATHVGNLLAFVQDRAIPNRQSSIARDDVLAALRLRDADFFPAPSNLDPVETLFETADARRLAEYIRTQPGGLLVVHGPSGVGKTSTIQLCAQELGHNSEIPIYDCFAAGQGMQAGRERFPFAKLFTQITNEIDSIYRTNILATTKLEYTHLLDHFRKAVAFASGEAALVGQRFILAIDAIDNAAEAAAQHELLGRESFVPRLLGIQWPENCTVVVTARTENLQSLGLPQGVGHFEVQGFTLEETKKHIQAFGSESEPQLVQHLHNRTKGNPRVQRRLLEEVEGSTLELTEQYIDEHARETAFQYYQDECPKRLKSDADRLILATVVEAAQPATIATIADVLRLQEGDVRTKLQELAFGLRINPEGQIGWRDQDFWDFAGDYTHRERVQALQLLAQYCQEAYDSSPYAKANLSRHLYASGKKEALLTWWLEGDRLPKRVFSERVHDEDVLQDIQYSLLAAFDLKRWSQVLMLLSLAAEVAQSRDVFAEMLRQHPRVAAQEDYVERLIQYAEDQQLPDEELGRFYLSVSNGLAEAGQNPVLSSDLQKRGSIVLQQANRSGLYRFVLEDISTMAAYVAMSNGLLAGLQTLVRWSPKEKVYPTFSTIAHDYAEGSDGVQVLDVLNFTLSDEQKAHALLGLLARGGDRAHSEHWRQAAEAVELALEKGQIHAESASDYVPGAVESLIRLRLPGMAQRLLVFWQPRPPRLWADASLQSLLRAKAVSEVLGLEKFDPSKLTFEEEGENREHSRLREHASEQYPALRARARAWGGASAEEVLQDVSECVEQLKRAASQRRERPAFGDNQVAAHLIEAVVYVPGYHPGAIKAVLKALRQSLPKAGDRWYLSIVDTLSGDSRYHGLAEEVATMCLEEWQLPMVRARDAIDNRLHLHPLLCRFDRELAKQVFFEARLMSGDFDAEVGARAAALLSAARMASAGKQVQSVRISELGSVLEYMKELEAEESSIDLGEYLEVASAVEPSVAFAFSSRWDARAVYDLREGAARLGLGLVGRHAIPLGMVWPLTELSQSRTSSVQLFQRTIEHMKDSSWDFRGALTHYAHSARVSRMGDRRLREARELLTWADANELSESPAVLQMSEFVQGIERVKEVDVTGRYQNDRFPIEPPAFVEPIQKQLQTSPDDALRLLQGLSLVELRSLWAHHLQEFTQRLAEALPSARIPEILNVLEVWAEDRTRLDVFAVLATIARHAKTDRSREIIKCFIERHLSAEKLSQLSAPHYKAECAALVSCVQGDKQVLLEMLVAAVANSIRELTADSLHRWVGILASLLDSPEAAFTFERILNFAQSRIKVPLPSPTYDVAEPQDALVRYIVDCLGHPRLDVRWRAAYALMQMVVEAGHEVISRMMREIANESHARWITRREWLLFTLHHLALRRPHELLGCGQHIIPHALSRSFPHAKIRHHAKEILLLIEQACPGTMSTALPAVRAINEPIDLTPTKKINWQHIPFEGKRWDERYDARFIFDSMDTLPYWYNSLGNCFALSRDHVADLAFDWIVNRWGITKQICRKEEEADPWKHDWTNTSNRQGSEPLIETLQLYAERHGMFMAAGILIDSKPVVLDGPREGDRWHDWIRYRLQAADPGLPGRFVDAPPIVSENYGCFDAVFEEWRGVATAADFEHQVLTEPSGEWLVFGGWKSGSFGERYFNVNVMSAFVKREAAGSLLKLLNEENARVDLPRIRMPHDTVLPNLETDLNGCGDYYVYAQGDETVAGGKISMRPTLVWWHQEMPFHGSDPKWPEHGREYPLPSPEVASASDLRREGVSMSWSSSTGEEVCRFETWHDSDGPGEGADYSHGGRLLVRRSWLKSVADQRGYDVVFDVQIRRGKTYRYRRSGDEAYTPGKRSAILLSQLTQP